MSALVRYAAAIYHLGAAPGGSQPAPPRDARDAALRALRVTPRAASSGRGSARGAFLPHAGGARLEAGQFTAVGRTLAIGDPPDWEAEAPLLWLFNLHYFAWLEALPRDEQRRLVLDWIERYPPRAATARLDAVSAQPAPAPLGDAAVRAGGLARRERARLLASIEAQAECLADTLEYHLRGNHLLESAITLKLLAACFRGPAVARWERRADALLDEELGEQFLLDGGHVERSPMYHARLAHGLLDLMNVLPDGDETRLRIEERLPGILRFLAAMRHPDGEIALFNDAALGIAPEPGAHPRLRRAARPRDAARSPPGPSPRRATTSGAAATTRSSWTPARSGPTTCRRTPTATSSRTS